MLPIEITADISLHPEFANGIRVDKRVTLSGPKSQVCHPQNARLFRKLASVEALIHQIYRYHESQTLRYNLRPESGDEYQLCKRDRPRQFSRSKVSLKIALYFCVNFSVLANGDNCQYIYFHIACIESKSRYEDYYDGVFKLAPYPSNKLKFRKLLITCQMQDLLLDSPMLYFLFPHSFCA